ncbi:MAG: CobW family GTP-binding protein [Clostridium sp.]|nr:CobW family GTP-binding protein [Clostridium sp.]MCM1459331.1 CobW family GTP-binding protein [Bacteroides sp.]
MTKIDIISGFLGAGKTTLIKKLINQVFTGEKLVLIENEFGEIGIDGGFLKDAGIEITEMNSGCICCSLVGDFGTALKKVIDEYAPDRIIIEPSGVGKLSDVIKAVEDVKAFADIAVNSATTVVDVVKCKMYMKNFGEFFNNQVESAGTIVLSRTQNVSDDKLHAAVDMLREHNKEASIITTPWDDIEASVILDAMEHSNSLAAMIEEAKKMSEHEHHHHHHDDHEHHHHDHDDHEHHHHDHDDHEHHHHDHDDHEHHHHHDHDDHEHHHHHDHDDHDHHHHHEHGEDCTCGCHDHDHHHHHADDVFTSWGMETANKYSDDEMKAILEKLADDSNEFGIILRAKGIVAGTGNDWIYFDLTPGEYEIRKGNPDYTGKLCVIGSELKEDAIAQLFKVV